MQNVFFARVGAKPYEEFHVLDAFFCCGGLLGSRKIVEILVNVVIEVQTLLYLEHECSTTEIICRIRIGTDALQVIVIFFGPSTKFIEPCGGIRVVYAVSPERFAVGFIGIAVSVERTVAVARAGVLDVGGIFREAAAPDEDRSCITCHVAISADGLLNGSAALFPLIRTGELPDAHREFGRWLIPEGRTYCGAGARILRHSRLLDGLKVETVILVYVHVVARNGLVAEDRFLRNDLQPACGVHIGIW